MTTLRDCLGDPAPAPSSAPRMVEVTRAVQRVVDELCADGATNAQIAGRLGVTQDTIKSHIKAATRAAGVSSRTALAVAVLRESVLLVDAPPRALGAACGLLSPYGSCDLPTRHDTRGLHGEHLGDGDWFAWTQHDSGLLPVGYGTFVAGRFHPEQTDSTGDTL